MSRSALAVLPLTMLLVGGCIEYEPKRHHDPVNGEDPDIRVAPFVLEFGQLTSGDDQTMSFYIENCGAAPLTVDDVEVVLGGESFTIVDSEIQGVLDGPTQKAKKNDPQACGEAMWIDVEFTPAAGLTNVGEIIVYSNDPDSPELPVALFGSGFMPELCITPEEHDFGTTFIPCGADVQIQFENCGSEDLVIDGFEYATDAGLLQLEHDIILPLTLEPNQVSFGIVHFDAATLGADSATLSVTSNDPAGVRQVSQWGDGAFEQSLTDVFNVPSDPPVDIMFAIDQSCSMDTEAQALGLAFDNFISEVDGITQNWKIGVLTLANGCFNSGVLTRNTPNYSQVFQDAVVVGGHHYLTERLLELSDVSLAQTGPLGCNANFLRPGALLHLVIVSDEPERSYTGWDVWLANLQTYTNPGMFKISAVVDINEQCGQGPDGYFQAAQATGGEILNICDENWANDVPALATASLTALSTFELTETPNEPSLVVIVNGIEMADGWVYNPNGDLIEFDDDTVFGGDVIEVTYQALADC